MAAIALQHPGRSGLAGALLLVTVPTERSHLIQDGRQFVEMHVTQFEELLFLVQQGQPAASPVGGGQRMLTDRTRFSLVPLLQQTLEVLWGRIDLRQAVLIAVTLLRPARAGMQARMLLAAQRGGEGELAVNFYRDGLTIIGTNHRASATIAEIGLQADANRKRHQQNRADDEENDRKRGKHGNTSRQKPRADSF